MNYVGSFGSGWSKVIKRKLERINDIKIINIYDGLVIFSSKNALNIKEFPFFNNIYLLLGMSKSSGDDLSSNISRVINNIDIRRDDIIKNLSNTRYSSFKILGIKENQPTKFNYKLVEPIEKKIAKELRINLGERAHDLDFIFTLRSEGIILFLLKLTYNRKTEKDLKQGSLRPELCNLLISYGDIKESDIVLDPFCGSGAIPKEIVKHFKYNMCFASDYNEEALSSFKKEYKGNNKKLFIKVLDALNLDKFDNNFIDLIVTDPPWNIYEKDESKDYVKFYRDMLIEFNRILKDDGRIVILMGNVKDFEESIKGVNTLYIDDYVSILVNGKKANCYLIKKK